MSADRLLVSGGPPPVELLAFGFSLHHVFTKGLPFEGAAAGVAREVKDASDHRPVWAELRQVAP